MSAEIARLRLLSRADMRAELQTELDIIEGCDLDIDEIPEIMSIEAERFGFYVDANNTIQVDSAIRARYTQNVYQEKLAANAVTNHLDITRFDSRKDDPNIASLNDPFDSTNLSCEQMLIHLVDSKGKSLKNRAKAIKPPYMLLQKHHFIEKGIWLDKGLNNVFGDRISEDSEARIILALNFVTNIELASKK